MDTVKKIYLSGKSGKGKYATVDEVDYKELSKITWYLGTDGYAYTNNSKNQHLAMHRVVNGTPKGKETDHINRDKLDNRRNNLRTASSTQNKINQKIRVDNTTGHKGVYWDKARSKWEVEIAVNRKRYHLGRFEDINDAIDSRQEAERTYFNL